MACHEKTSFIAFLIQFQANKPEPCLIIFSLWKTFEKNPKKCIPRGTNKSSEIVAKIYKQHYLKHETLATATFSTEKIVSHHFSKLLKAQNSIAAQGYM